METDSRQRSQRDIARPHQVDAREDDFETLGQRDPLVGVNEMKTAIQVGDIYEVQGMRVRVTYVTETQVHVAYADKFSLFGLIYSLKATTTWNKVDE